MWMRRPIILTSLVIGLCAMGWLTSAGCLGPREVGTLQTFQLNPTPDPERSPRAVYQPVSATLVVNVPKARAGFDTLRMAYVTRPHEIRYFTRNQWVDSPSHMLLPPLVQTLENSAIWDAVVVLPSVVRGDFRLDLENLALQQEFFTEPSQIHLVVRAQLIDVRRQCVLGTTDFDVLQPAPSDDPYGGVVAANRATAKLLEQLVAWLSTYMNEGAQAGCLGTDPAAEQSRSAGKA